MIFTRWFRKNQPEDYEQVLSNLALDIQKRETHLSEIRLRERRSSLLFSVYALAFWLVYTSLWYMDLLPNLSGHRTESKFEKSVRGVPVVVGPVIILFIRRIVQIWYTRIGDAEEKALIALRRQRRDKVEEIKKTTNYYSTRNLIERYDDEPKSPLRQRMLQPATPQRQQPAQQQQGHTTATPQTPAQMSQALQQRLSPSPQRPLPPPRKQWFDKLADAILGDDDGAVSGAAARYALICQKCFSHNGLVKESMWEDTQYVCPKCGHFNPSARAVREARKSRTPERTPAPASTPGENSTHTPNGGVRVVINGPPEESTGRSQENGLTKEDRMEMEVDS